MITIELNGEATTLPAGTSLAALIARRGPAPVAAAVNGRFVPAGARAGTTLQPGDRVELVSPMEGG
ncbi:MAG TPA: sulfur carrier protein ThiS [Porticoccaceae bacterium]|nr:sulfur carrier protein ThiS [Pseudomonadota bacterium]HLS99050.1 sulfur carrier protein ThiS [Porticoccaceae bacterium]